MVIAVLHCVTNMYMLNVELGYWVVYYCSILHEATNPKRYKAWSNHLPQEFPLWIPDGSWIRHDYWAWRIIISTVIRKDVSQRLAPTIWYSLNRYHKYIRLFGSYHKFEDSGGQVDSVIHHWAISLNCADHSGAPTPKSYKLIPVRVLRQVPCIAPYAAPYIAPCH